VAGDRRALRQIVINLLSNGVKFTPSGGTVSLRLAEEAGMAVLSVTDTGIGISPDFLPFVFEPFRQQDSGLARKFEGTGLGLAITKRLAEGHGGTISIASTEGVGTCVTVRLPLLAADGATAAA
jgi:signal transduction histidine kinase